MYMHYFYWLIILLGIQAQNIIYIIFIINIIITPTIILSI